MRTRTSIAVLILLCTLSRAAPPLILSGNDNKLDIRSGSPVVVQDPEPDSITLLDFSTFPPKVQHVPGIENSVVGPPSNIVITPDARLALIANSATADPQDSTKWIPASNLHVVNLEADPPAVIQEVRVGRQPSGMSLSPDGRYALVVNRADGTISTLAIDDDKVSVTGTAVIGTPEDQYADVGICPDGKRALAVSRAGGYLLELALDNGKVTPTDRKISVYGKPYHVVISPDGRFALTSGVGTGNALDADAVTVVDLGADPPRTVDYVPVGREPESLDISPDGRLVAAAAMEGSFYPPDHPFRGEQGGVYLLARRGGTFEPVMSLPCGRIPEGVAFTGDGKYLVVQCNGDAELWVYEVSGGRIRDTDLRIKVPGMPASLRALR